MNSTQFDPIYLYSAISLILSIIIHETGHLIAAKRCGCKVLVFSIGFGRPFFQKFIHGTIYQVAWILLGGYCSLKGEMDYRKSKYALTNLKYMQKLYVVLAGVGVNCLTGLIAYGLYWIFGGEFFFYFAFLTILLGLSNLIPIPGIDGSYPFLFLLEKVFGKKEGIKVMQRAVDVGMFFINMLNIGCVYYCIYVGVKWLIAYFN